MKLVTERRARERGALGVPPSLGWQPRPDMGDGTKTTLGGGSKVCKEDSRRVTHHTVDNRGD